MAIDKLNSLKFLFFRSDYFGEFGDRDGVHVDRVPFELRQRLLRWTWPTTARDQYFFQHDGRDVITREGWEAFMRWVCRAMDRQLEAEGDHKAFAGLPVRPAMKAGLKFIPMLMLVEVRHPLLRLPSPLAWSLLKPASDRRPARSSSDNS